jgi:hypothetical protein
MIKLPNSPFLDDLYLSPVSSVVQFHPQLHHLDAIDEMPKAKGARSKKDDDERPSETEARAIDIKVKAAEDGEAAASAGNLDLLKQMQEEKWKSYEWIDAEVRFSTVWTFLMIRSLITLNFRPKMHGIRMRATCFTRIQINFRLWKQTWIRKSISIK